MTSFKLWKILPLILALLQIMCINVIGGAKVSEMGQAFLREPSDQIAIVGEHVTLPCRVVNKRGVLQWTRDDFGLGTDRNLTGFKRYRMSGSDEEGKYTLLLLLFGCAEHRSDGYPKPGYHWVINASIPWRNGLKMQVEQG